MASAPPPLYFVSINAVHGAPSFEELRIQNYDKSYSSTGRPPAPCPQMPESESERRAQGLPPLFRRITVDRTLDFVAGEVQLDDDSQQVLAQAGMFTNQGAASVFNASTSTIAGPIAGAGALPSIQALQPVKVPGGDILISIVAQNMFNQYSPEELRLQAYRAGHIMPPTPIPIPDPAPVTPVIRPPYFARDTAATAYATMRDSSGAVSPQLEHFHSISAASSSKYHSFEELRLGYLTAGREVNSAELFAASAPKPQLFSSSVSPLASPPAPTSQLFVGPTSSATRPRGDAFSQTSLPLRHF